MKILETLWLAMKSSTAPGSNSRATMPVAPLRKPIKPQPEPPIWATGMATRLMSSAVHTFQLMFAAFMILLVSMKLACVSIAPFGRPVVPEV